MSARARGVPKSRGKEEHDRPLSETPHDSDGNIEADDGANIIAARNAMLALVMIGLPSVEESGWGWRPEIG